MVKDISISDKIPQGFSKSDYGTSFGVVAYYLRIWKLVFMYRHKDKMHGKGFKVKWLKK